MQNIGRQIILSMVLVVVSWNTAMAAMRTGGVAPDFTLHDSTGYAHTLSDYRGKYVVLEWLNPDCPFVRKHYDSGNMQTLQQHYIDQGVVWLSINSSAPGQQGHLTAARAVAFREQRGTASTAILFDHDGVVGHRYGAKTTPHMFVIDPAGTLIYQGAIDDTPSADPADVAAAVNYVAAAIDTSLRGLPVARGSTQAYGCSVKYGVP